MIDDKYKIGNFIQQLRKDLNMTQKDLGKILGVTNKAVSKWEVGENSPDSSLFPIISKVLGVTVDELYQGYRKSPKDQDDILKKEYLRSLKYLKYNIRFILTVLLSYLLYFFIYLMIKPIKWSPEYFNDIRILFELFIPIMIYLISSASYTLIKVNEILKSDIPKSRKILIIIVIIIFFILIIIPITLKELYQYLKLKKKYFENIIDD